jgi:hypothetical protein
MSETIELSIEFTDKTHQKGFDNKDFKILKTDIERIVKKTRLTGTNCKTRYLVNGEIPFTWDATHIQVTGQDKAGSNVFALTATMTLACKKITRVNAVRTWVKLVLNSIVNKVKGETGSYTILTLQCNASNALRLRDECGATCTEPSSVKIVSNVNGDEIWTEISDLLDTAKEDFLLLLQLTWPTHSAGLSEKCEAFLKKDTSRDLLMRSANDNFSVRAPLLFATLKQIKSVQRMIRKRVMLRCETYMNTKSSTQWWSVLQPVENQPNESFPRLDDNRITEVSADSNRFDFVWYSKETLADVRAFVNRAKRYSTSTITWLDVSDNAVSDLDNPTKFRIPLGDLENWQRVKKYRVTST